jgi:hypothetical protein
MCVSIVARITRNRKATAHASIAVYKETNALAGSTPIRVHFDGLVRFVQNLDVEATRQ